MFRHVKNIHFIGIGGIGMSGIAEVLCNLGFNVSGSDAKKSKNTERLETLFKIKISEGHAAENVGEAQVVVYSSAVKDDNPEVAIAKEKGIPVIPRAEMLAELMVLKPYAVAVSGTHGKTSTTSMVATILGHAGFDPTTVVGGVVDTLGSNARLGASDWFVTEADESERRQKEFVEKSEMFQTELDVDETLAQLLVAEGFGALEEVAYVDPSEIAQIEGFDEELAAELQNRAQEALDRREEANRELRRSLGVEDALAEMPHLNEAMLVTLGNAGIKTLDDLADLATDELIQKKRIEPRRKPGSPEPKGGVLADYNLSEAVGNEIIMAARAHWFEDEVEGDASADVSQ